MSHYHSKQSHRRTVSTMHVVFLTLLGPVILVSIVVSLDYSSSSSVVRFINGQLSHISTQVNREKETDYNLCPLESHTEEQDNNVYVHSYGVDSSKLNNGATNLLTDKHDNCLVVPPPVDLCVEHGTLFRHYVSFYDYSHNNVKYSHYNTGHGSRPPFLKLYRLCGLNGDGSTYEVRASFLGSPPARVSLTLFTVVKDYKGTKIPIDIPSSSSSSVKSTGRKLLDVEKLMFRTPLFQEYDGKNDNAVGKVSSSSVDSARYSFEGMQPYEGQTFPVKRYSSIQEALLDLPLPNYHGSRRYADTVPLGTLLGISIATDTHHTTAREGHSVETHVLTELDNDAHTIESTQEQQDAGAITPHIPADGELYCVVTAYPKGVALDPNVWNRGVLFNIKLERMYLTQFPRNVMIYLFGLAWVLFVLILVRGTCILERAVKVATDVK